MASQFKRHDKVRVLANSRTGKVLRVRDGDGVTEYLINLGLYLWVWHKEDEIEKLLRVVK